MSEKPKTAPHGILKNSRQEFNKPSNEIKISGIRSLNSDEINEFKMLKFPMKLKVPPPTNNQNVEEPIFFEEPKVIEEPIIKFNDLVSESENPKRKQITSSRTNYLNISSNESIRSNKICKGKLSKRNSTERYHQSNEEIPISAREKQEIEKYFGGIEKPSSVSYNSPTESSGEEEILETSNFSIQQKRESKQKNIQKILELIKLKNERPKKIQQAEKLSMYLPASNQIGHKSHQDCYERVPNLRLKRSKNPKAPPSKNFIQENIRASSSTNLRNKSSHRIISVKSSKYSPPIESLKLDQEPIATMMETVNREEEKNIVSIFL